MGQFYTGTPTTGLLSSLPTLGERDVWVLAPRAVERSTPAFDPILPGSAIVAAPRGVSTPFVAVYFEGNLFRAQNQHAYLERVVNAWGRLVYRYPTIAMMGLTPEQLLLRYEVIGTFDGKAASWLPEGQAKAEQIQQAYERYWARPGAGRAPAEAAL